MCCVRTFLDAPRLDIWNPGNGSLRSADRWVAYRCIKKKKKRLSLISLSLFRKRRKTWRQNTRFIYFFSSSFSFSSFFFRQSHPYYLSESIFISRTISFSLGMSTSFLFVLFWSGINPINRGVGINPVLRGRTFGGFYKLETEFFNLYMIW